LFFKPRQDCRNAGQAKVKSSSRQPGNCSHCAGLNQGIAVAMGLIVSCGVADGVDVGSVAGGGVSGGMAGCAAGGGDV
jgi:hypothetical protein